MFCFDRKLALCLLFFTLPLLFLPKFNLVSVSGETAGIRMDDIVLFFVAGLFTWTYLLLRKKLERIETLVIAYTLFSLFSFVINRLLVYLHIVPVEAKIFYVFRLAEYFFFFYVGWLAVSFISIRWLIGGLFCWNLVWICLQKMGWMGAVSIWGYTEASSRVQGIASFPSEMGLWLNLLFCWIVFTEKEEEESGLRLSSFAARQVGLYGLFALFAALVIWTGNRISILALFICFLGKLCLEYRGRAALFLMTALFFGPLLVMSCYLLMSQTESVSDRSLELFSVKNFHLVEQVWNTIDFNADPLTPEGSEAEAYDASWWLRIHKWAYILKIYVSHPVCYLQGIGPGCAWSALDGGFLRILVETGLVGSWLFFSIFRLIAKINIQLRWMVIAWMLNMCFFDAYLAYKPMSILFFCGGAVFYAHQHKYGLLSGCRNSHFEVG